MSEIKHCEVALATALYCLVMHADIIAQYSYLISQVWLFDRYYNKGES